MQTLQEFMTAQQVEDTESSRELSALFSALNLAAKVVHYAINKAGLVNVIGEVETSNVHGEQQKKLDIYANEKFKAALAARGVVCGLASEEEDDFVVFDQTSNDNADYVVLLDPLDGSSNIDVNVSVGTIFSIYRRQTKSGSEVSLEDFLQAGTEQVAAGYILYGSSTMLVYTIGAGVNGFTYDSSLDAFCLSHPNINIPQEGTVYSVNEGNYSHFTPPVKQYIQYCQADDLSENRPYSARYIGSFVSDFHRNLIQGGIYLYPESSLYPNGKLRLLYECNPLALLVEQAGGRAISALGKRILDIQPTELHQCVPIFIGSRDMVQKIEFFMREYKKSPELFENSNSKNYQSLK